MIMHIWVDKRIRPCCQSLNKLQHKNTLTRAHMCSGWVGTSARTIRRVSGESSKAELNTDFDEWSVKTMSPSWPPPPLPRRVCECARWKGGGDRGLSLHVFLSMCGREQLCLKLRSVYYFGNPWSPVWMARLRRNTSQWSGVRWWVKWQRAQG